MVGVMRFPLLYLVCIIVFLVFDVTKAGSLEIRRHTREKPNLKSIVEKSVHCGKTLERICNDMSDACHMSVMTKRSIQDEEWITQREKRAASKRKRGKGRKRKRRRRRKRKRIQVDCNLCKAKCW